MRRASLVAACFLAVLAAGCGGGDSSTEAWADDFCGAIDDWRERVQDAAGELAEPAALSEEQLDESIREAVAASDDLLADLGELGLPELEARDEIEQELDHLESVLRERVQDAAGELAEPAALSEERLDESIREAVAASDDLLADLGELGLPELEARDEIEQELDHLESVLRERAANARAGIDQPAGSVSEALARLAALSRELAAAAATIELTIEKLRALDPAGELKQALESSDACANLRG